MKPLTTLLLAAMMLAGTTANAADDTKPWTFWYWMYGAVSRPGIHADLVAMQRAGLGGFYLMPIRSPKEKPELGGTITQLSPEFWQMVDYSLQQADSLGLGVGVHVSDGFALAGGPWITPEESMQQVVWSDTVVGSLDHVNLSQPPTREGYYRDIRCVAIPLKEGQELWAEPQSVDGTIRRNEKGIFFSKQPGTIDFTFAQPILLRAIEITPQSANVQSQRLTVMASDDGTAWREVCRMEPPRQGWQSNGHAFTFALPPTRAAHIRLQWTPDGTEPGSEELDQAKWNPTLKLEGVRFLTVPRIGGYEGKNGSEWRISAATTEREIPRADCVSPADVVLMRADGDVFSPASPLGRQPKGRRWLVIRIGHTSTGMTNATGGARGLECDKFSVEAATKQFNDWYGRFIELPHASAISHFHIDSWECGTQNWGSDFASEFQRRRGYDLLPWLPVMAGVPMETVERSEQVLRDVRLTVSDLVRDRFYATTTRLAHARGKTISHESIAPTFVADGMEHYKQADVAMGEFWLNSPTHDKPNDMLDAVSGAHIYGKNIVQAEGFTEVRGVWDEPPASLKALLDRNYCWGMNKMVLHVCAHNPWTDRRPGMTLDGIGLFFQRDNTWYPMADGLTGYMSRCQRWLQRGRPVADIAVFSGEEMPRRALTPDKLVPVLPGLFGPERVASERKRLANEGCPMVESPVGVRHNANIFSLDGWNNPLHGYQYDTVNPDVLLGDSSSSMLQGHYRVIVVPQGKQVGQAVARRIGELRQRGAIVVDSVYTEGDFTSLGVPPDATLPDGMAYTHRHADGWGDIYFLSNQSGHEFNATVKLRAKAPCATLYDPLADLYSQLKANADGSYTVDFAANGSAFILLTNEPMAEAAEPMQLSKSQEIDGKWTVSYPETGISREVSLPDDWTQSDDPCVRYYSGIATYSTTFRLKGKPAKRVRLRLPASSGMTYRVSVNGEDCGVAWTAPYTVDISGHLRRGHNTLSIEAANTWRNALLGASLGVPPYTGIWTNAKYRRADKNLDPAGLLGPVVLEY